MSIHTVDAGETLSSGCEFQSSRNSRIYESKVCSLLAIPCRTAYERVGILDQIRIAQ